MAKEEPQLNLQSNQAGGEQSYELDLKAQEQKQRLLDEQKKKYAKNKKVCQEALKSMPSTSVTWIFLLIVFIGGYVAGIVTKQLTPSGSATFIITTLVEAVFAFVFFSRMIGTVGFGKRFSVDRKIYLKEMPDEPTPVIQDLYVAINCRRCIHYWLTFCLACISILSVLYMTIASGIAYSKLELFKSSRWSSITGWDISQKVVIGGGAILLILWLQYSMLDSRNKRIIRSLECVYGKDKLVNDCLLSYKVNEVNRKYKTIVFAIVCLYGCAFYIFFKKMLCALFDKSFCV